MSGSVYAPFAELRAMNPLRDRAAYTLPNLITVILTNCQDTRRRYANSELLYGE